MDVKQAAIDWLKTTYTEDEIEALIDEEIISGNWVDEEDLERDQMLDEYQWYAEFGNGEAQDSVRQDLVRYTLQALNAPYKCIYWTEEFYKQTTQEDLYKTIIAIFPRLNT